MKEDFLIKITNENFNVDLANFSVENLLVEFFAKEVYINERVLGNKSTRNKSLRRLPKSPATMIPASGVSSCTRFLSSNPNELCDGVKLLLQEKEAGTNHDISNEEFETIAEKLLEQKRISTKQHSRSLTIWTFAEKWRLFTIWECKKHSLGIFVPNEGLT